MHPERVRLLKEGKEKPGPVAYWMSRDQRANDNWALHHSQQLAAQRKVPLIVVFCMVPEFLGATVRQYAFMIKGLQETEQNLESKNITFNLLCGLPEIELVKFVKRHKIGILITDFDPLRIKKLWKRRVAEKINIPFFFSEPKEFAILVKIVTKIDMFLYNKLPNEIYDSIRSLDDGIVSDAEAKQDVSRLSKLANEAIDIPYLSEITEHFVIRLLVGSIVNGMRKNSTLDKSIVHANDISVPDEDFEDDEDEDEDFLFG